MADEISFVLQNIFIIKPTPHAVHLLTLRNIKLELSSPKLKVTPYSKKSATDILSNYHQIRLHQIHVIYLFLKKHKVSTYKSGEGK